MKRIVIATALALALPAFAAEEADQAAQQPQPAEKAAVQENGAAQEKAGEKVASEGISEEVTLVNGATGNGGAASEKTPTLRFERWARDEDNDPFETQESWNSRR
ncbi:MAG TPA: hypothetical protein VLS49_08675 [Usitatibacter sp.]|nr:hypothetical protein [Usitatibacter sp.]